MKGELKKLRIESYADPEYQKGPEDTFVAMFNPSTYTVKHSVEFDKKQGMGTTGLPQRYKKSAPSEFSLEFTLDGTGASSKKEDVADKLDHFLAVVYKYDGEIHRPRYLKVVWGTLLFNCVFKDASVKYTLFRPDGSPLRVVVSATFLGFIEDRRRAATQAKRSPDLMRQHVVLPSDTLPLLCHRYYGSAALAVWIARHNGLDDLVTLRDGQVLLFPPLEKRGRGTG